MKNIGYIQKTIAADDTTAVSVGLLPANAFITDIKCIVSTAFSAGETIDIGTASSAAYFASNIDVDAVGKATVSLATTGIGVQSATDQTEVKAVVDGVASGSPTSAPSLLDLSATDLTLGQDYNGTIRTFRIWADDIGDTGIEEASS